MNGYHRVLAFDFDGALAENGSVPPALRAGLERLRAQGYVLFAATSRLFGAAPLNSLLPWLSGMVWENGAVLHHTATDEVYLPFGHIDPRLVDALHTAGVPLARGKASVSTALEHHKAVWQALNGCQGGAKVTTHKGELLISPPGTAMGAGLKKLLDVCDYSPRNLVSFGAGENNLSLLQLGEIGVAIADAAPLLKEIADWVTTRPGPAGVLEALQTYRLHGNTQAGLRAWRRERLIPLGEDETGAAVSLPGAALAGGNLGVFGDSGSGKSWVTGLLAEGIHRAGYQSLLIDPEGDYRGLRALPGVAVIEGNSQTLPSASTVVGLLEKTNASIVLDLCAYPVESRGGYLTDLLRGLQALKTRKFRPHWIVLEEAQYFLPPDGNSLSQTLLPMLTDGGWAFVSFRPDRLASPVLAALDRCLVTCLSEPEAVRTLCRWFSGIEELPANIPHGHAWLCGERLVRLRSNTRRVPHIRHLHKYLDAPLPPHKRFSFRDERGFLGLQAASLRDLLHCLPSLPIDSLAYHQARGDFTAWAESALGDGILAAQLGKIAHRSLAGETLRGALLQCVTTHYAELHAGR